MDNPKSLGELGEHYRRIAQVKIASGCKACQMEGRVMLEMVEDMERVNRIGETGTDTASCPSEHTGSTGDTGEHRDGSDSGTADEVQQ